MQEMLLGEVGAKASILMHFDTDISDVYGGAVTFMNGGTVVTKSNAEVYLYTALAKFGAGGVTAKGTDNSRFYVTPAETIFGSRVDSFTVDCWALFNASDGLSSFRTLTGFWDSTSTHSETWLFGRSSGNVMQLRYRAGSSGTWLVYNTTVNPNDNALHHYALTVRGSQFWFFRDGAIVVSGSVTRNYTDDSVWITGVGCCYDTTYASADDLSYVLLDELRVVVGRAVWTSTFRPPVQPYRQ